MSDIKIIGVDLAKTNFHIVGVDCKGKILLKKKIHRSDLSSYFAGIKTCTVVMESCGSCHYWARKFTDQGHDVKLIAAQHIKPYRRKQKNDYNDAVAITEAAVRPEMHFVGIKSTAEQDIQSLIRSRQLIVQQRTATGNQIRGLLLEYGITIPKGVQNLNKHVPVILMEAELTSSLKRILQQQYEHYLNLDEREKAFKKQLEQLSHNHPEIKRVMKVPGVGCLVGSAFVSSLGDPTIFKNGRHVSAWLGVVPRQDTTGGVPKLLGITKRGDRQLRALIIHGARSVVLAAIKRKKPRNNWEEWVLKLYEKKGWNVTSVAVANKMTRTMWHLIKHQEEFKFAA
jgi:transposase